jgi:acetyl esterase/lipase
MTMDILYRTPIVADHRLPYGEGLLQFGDLYLPKLAAAAKAPLVVFFHGGWWQAEYDLGYASFLCDALRKDGIAVWSVEYRRIGNVDGGWPGTFTDAALGFEFVKKLASSYPLDLSRAVVAGHSAGAHLAFWVAGRHHVPEGSPLHEPRPGLAVRAVVSLAGAVDLRRLCDLSGSFEFTHCKKFVVSLMGGLPKDVPDRYAAGNPGDLLPLGVPQWLVQGAEDGQIPPELPTRWQGNARRQHDAVDVTIVPGAGHFEIVDPESNAWGFTRAAFRMACAVK